MKKKSEVFYYNQLMPKLKEDFRCFKIKSRIGTEDVGQVDIVGIRDIGGYSSGQIELLVFEVKKAHEIKGAIAHFGKQLGQTLSYSLISNRCYLLGLFFPHEKGFSDEQKLLANHFGIGLIDARIDKSGRKVKQIKEISTSNYFEPPIIHKTDKVLSHLGIKQCCICKIYYDKEKNQLERFDIPPKILERTYLFSTHKHKELRVCSVCKKRFDFGQGKTKNLEKKLTRRLSSVRAYARRTRKRIR